MSPFDYALGLISILMSLALADIVLSFHKLMRHSRTIKWDARPLIAAVLVTTEVVRVWFATWTIRDVQELLSFPVYGALFLQVMLLVLTAIACLPDEVDDGCDLGRFYERNAPYFWGAFAASQAGYFLLWLIFGGGQDTVGGHSNLGDWLRCLVPLAAYVLLACVRRRWLDYLVPLSGRVLCRPVLASDACQLVEGLVVGSSSKSSGRRWKVRNGWEADSLLGRHSAAKSVAFCRRE